MNLPDGRPLRLAPGVLPEASPRSHLAFWLPRSWGDADPSWLRVGVAAGVEARHDGGIAWVPAVAIPARRRPRGVGGWLRGPGGASWTMPDGSVVEPAGPRRGDAVLAWPAEPAGPLEEAKVRVRWPVARAVESIGDRLYCITGIAGHRPAGSATVADSDAGVSAPERAERSLDQARAARDPRLEAVALAELGQACLWSDQHERAAAVLSEALTAAGRVGDRELRAWVQIDLGLAELGRGHLGEAQAVLESALAQLGAAVDRPAAKVALDRLARVLAHKGDHRAALARLGRALRLAQDLSDFEHEADLLWRAAIELAELGRRRDAAAAGQAAVDRMRQLRRPKVEWYADLLVHFRAAAVEISLVDPEGSSLCSPGLPGDSDRIHAVVPRSETGHGLIQMARSTGAVLARFVGSGSVAGVTELSRERL